jgi:hypothetical protein
MAGRVQVIAPDGTRGSVDARDIDNLPDGARVLSNEEIAQEKLEAEYAKASTGSKIAGAVLGAGPRPPQVDAFAHSAQSALTAGISPAVTRVAADAIKPGAGKAYAERLDDEATAYPGTTTAGAVTGIAGGAAIGMAGGGSAGAGLARGLPMNALGTAAAPIEHGVVKALGGLATRGALGRAATQGAAMAVRGAVEGAAYSGIEQAASDVTHDQPIRGEKLYAAMGHGALGGGVIGGGLGAAGSLVGSALRSSARVASRRGGFVPDLEPLGMGEAAPAGREVKLGADALDAGLHEKAPAGVDVFDFSRREVSIRGQGKVPKPSAERPLDITGRMSIDPDAGLFAPRGKVTDPFNFGQERKVFPHDPKAATGNPKMNRHFETLPIDDIDSGPVWDSAGKLKNLRKKVADGVALDPIRVAQTEGGRWEVVDGIHRLALAKEMGMTHMPTIAEYAPGTFKGSGGGGLADTFDFSGKVSATSRPVRQRFDIGLDPDAGIAERAGGKFQGKFATEDPFYTSTAKDAPRRAGLRADPGELGPVEAKSPINMPWMDVDGVAASAGKMDATGAARGMAHDWAWRAVGGGFGLQSTRYAKEAAKHFPGGTKDLGEVALRFDLIDRGAAASSPKAAAWTAAKSGTPADIAPRAARASDEVGAKIGAITEASGARIEMGRVMSAADDVVKQYRREAGRGPLASAAQTYGDELRGVLRPGSDGRVSLQDVLAQRKILDDIVYEEAKTLDPRGRVKALREVRGNLESIITDALDEASGKVPGAQRAEYQRLKKDYHALRILSEAAEDSAARSSKGATFGLGEKFAMGSAVASGHLLSAPVIGLAGKMVKERGAAAAAAFLSRAAEQGMIARAVEKVDLLVGNAARNVLREGAAEGRGLTAKPRTSPREVAISREQGRAQQAEKQAQARAIVQWAGQHQANPAQMIRQIEEAAAQVGQHGGPKTAEAYTTSTLRAINFIIGHIPAKERRDPLDPRTTPPLTYEEADKLVRATKYAVQPMTVWDDFARGKVTTEGIRAAKAFMPDTYTEFQGQLMEHVQNHMLRNKKLTASQRLRVDKLLGFPAGPDLRPDTIRRLQANLMKAPDPAGAGAPAAPPAGGNPPLNMQVQQSGFDAIEARVAG